MAIRTLFVTRLYEAMIDNPALIEELEDSVRMLATDDRAGQGWSKAHGYRGYTSYASLNDLPARDPVIADLVKLLNGHVRRFAEESHLDLGRRLRLDSLWVNLMKPGATHSGHIHPHSVISGTFYVCVPPGSGGLKLEDPRLPLMMAAPPRTSDAPEDSRSFVYAEPKPGMVLLWESWLRHEVPPSTAKGDRISISFNYS
ncbi:TIGR02466 family protein [Rhizorhabdus wittichii]|uniref:TIGR02466 family protein n=1 Tax=Rhizorhabdus wittichii TaxID=160791 RepID=UPI00030AE9BF|nr:TIGR02466 family protein [Rhizorhabdus wittichii]